MLFSSVANNHVMPPSETLIVHVALLFPVSSTPPLLLLLYELYQTVKEDDKNILDEKTYYF